MSAWQIAALIIAALVGGGGIASLFTVKSIAKRTTSEARKFEQDADKADAEARKVLSEATVSLMQPLIVRAGELEKKLHATEVELSSAKRAAEELTRSLEHAQAETQDLRAQVDQMSKDMTALQQENERLRDRPLD